jgi:hypothetical protein
MIIVYSSSELLLKYGIPIDNVAYNSQGKFKFIFILCNFSYKL